jgi:hypothetical protein
LAGRIEIFGFGLGENSQNVNQVARGAPDCLCAVAGIKERIAFAATVTAEQADAARNVMAAARAHVRNLAPPGSVMTAPASPRLRGVLVERWRVLDGLS